MKNGKYKMYENLVFVSQVGLMMALPIVICVIIGNYIDEKLGTGSIFLLVFIALGVASSFLNLYKIMMRLINKDKRK